MATTKDWSAFMLTQSAATVYFAGGDAANYCVHTPPNRAKRQTIRNFGATPLYVCVPSIAGSAAGKVTDHNIRLEPNAAGAGYGGEAWTFSLVDASGQLPGGAVQTFSTFGDDGAAHPMRIVFDNLTDSGGPT